MKVKVKFFALARELTGKREEDIEMAEGATVRALVNRLIEEHGAEFRDYMLDPTTKAPRMNLQLLLNGRNISLLQGFDTTLTDGCSLAIIPPVGGG